MLRTILIAIAASAVCAAQPHIVNAKMDTRPASAGLAHEYRAIVDAAAAPAWIGYSVAAIEGDHRECCWDGGSSCRCSLEGGHASEASGQTEKLESSGRIAVLVRIESKQVSKIRVYAENCGLDAGGLAVHWLTDVKPAESVALLATFVRGGDQLSDSAILAIALHEDQAADRTMKEFIASSQPQPVREKAIFWLGAARGRRGYEALRVVVRDDPSDKIREKAVFALSINKTPEAVDSIVETAKGDKSAHIRGQALFWLGQKAGQKAAATITDAIANDPDTEVKKHAVFSLSQLPKEQGVPLLIQTARNNRNPEVRKQAMFWLGQSQDERALAFFEEVLGR
jgi:HEAT repeat protein